MKKITTHLKPESHTFLKVQILHKIKYAKSEIKRYTGYVKYIQSALDAAREADNTNTHYIQDLVNSRRGDQAKIRSMRKQLSELESILEDLK